MYYTKGKCRLGITNLIKLKIPFLFIMTQRNWNFKKKSKKVTIVFVVVLRVKHWFSIPKEIEQDL